MKLLLASALLVSSQVSFASTGKYTKYYMDRSTVANVKYLNDDYKVAPSILKSHARMIRSITDQIRASIDDVPGTSMTDEKYEDFYTLYADELAQADTNGNGAVDGDESLVIMEKAEAKAKSEGGTLSCSLITSIGQKFDILGGGEISPAALLSSSYRKCSGLGN